MQRVEHFIEGTADKVPDGYRALEAGEKPRSGDISYREAQYFGSIERAYPAGWYVATDVGAGVPNEQFFRKKES